MSLKCDISEEQRINTYKNSVAINSYLYRDLKKMAPALLSRFRLYDDTPMLGTGGSAAAFGVGKTRSVKITGDSNDALINYYLQALNKKVPHLVRVYSVVEVGGYYLIRAERLHTRIYDMGFCAWDDKWPFGLTSTLLKDTFSQALKSVGLDDSFLQDCGTHNVMFDERNRPTWYDFSHYGTDIAVELERTTFKKKGFELPYWSPEHKDIIHPKFQFKPRKAKK